MASPSDATDPKDLDAEMARRQELWMAKHGRVYKDDAEKARRFEIFKENIKHIEDFNRAGKHKYTLGEGPFIDLTSEEFKTTYASGCKVSQPEEEEEETEKPLGAPLPSSVDRETGGCSYGGGEPRGIWHKREPEEDLCRDGSPKRVHKTRVNG